MAATPAPNTSYAWYFDMATDHPVGLKARATISGVAQIDSICSPRPDCQVSGETSRGAAAEDQADQCQTEADHDEARGRPAAGPA